MLYRNADQRLSKLPERGADAAPFMAVLAGG
jgi:hypothetical protein